MTRKELLAMKVYLFNLTGRNSEMEAFDNLSKCSEIIWQISR